MAVHDSTISLLNESLREHLHAAEMCINFRKDITWGQNQKEGCLGFPGVTLMFCIVDAIGSYHRGKKDFRVKVDGLDREIKKNSFHHFFILNSDYYGEQLNEQMIKKIYDNYRCTLLHNSALPTHHILFMGEPEDTTFPIQDEKVHVNVPAFLRITRSAVAKFLERMDKIVPLSDQNQVTARKR